LKSQNSIIHPKCAGDDSANGRRGADRSRLRNMPPLSEDLKESISAYIKAWHMMSGVYAGVSFVLRLTLITRSALVAAKVGAGKISMIGGPLRSAFMSLRGQVWRRG
jgi:hypothetical protein